jgi:acyl carrier protein
MSVPAMTKTFDTIADIIADVCNVDRDKISPESHVINDLGIDSLDFLDVTFAIDKSFGIKMPIQKWTEEVNEDNSKAERYFVMKNLCLRIDELVAAKSA